LGGLSKKAYQLEKIRELYEVPSLTVDGGNLLFKQESLNPALAQQMTITAAGIIDAYSLMQFDAVAVGKNDLAAGLPFLKEQASRAQFPWLSANLVRKSDRKPIFSASLIRKFDDFTVGLIGLTGDDAKVRFSKDDDAVILPWREVLPDQIADLSPRCDLLILLSNNSTKQNQEIAESFEDIHLIIQSFPHSGNFKPRLFNKTLITQTGKQGKYLAWMLINWQQSKTWSRKGSIKELSIKKQELDGINGRISRIERREKKESLPANSSYQNLLKARKRLVSAINVLENEIATLKSSGSAPSTYENNFIALDLKLPDQADVEQIVKVTKQNVNEAGRRSAAKAAISRDRKEMSLEKLVFAGWQVCSQCHRAQTDFWEKTAHSSAYQTLVEQEQQFNLDCLPCHVTAEYETTRISDDDAVLLSLPAALLQVGCEICHGPGKTHASSQDPSRISRKPDASICLRCHTPERDEEFNYENDLERIACPASPR
jgi:2',3'-cyclic-nucleotide 2'-phosphodiesterase (5'-nucleotidase family)